ncbi:alkaline phosphatase D family protein [Aquihabitans sp. G128]|uniref:alkaline phosphatase D family protein n=1 Tax=Aquihabitans sp. G128 TaxID=2849779 RepID=UPI001C2431B2|nr:alkaline phosphatase D family protein [Aquihabitans sp. G128]QXC62832.1 alkaline phosphatase D family protein [Aquihabitans sp. G128]
MNTGKRDGEQQGRAGIGRRQFLTGAAATAAVLTVGCGSSGSEGSGPSSTARATTSTVPKPVHVPELSGDPFTLGVASGDPRTDAVVLWTRLAPEPVAEDGSGGMPDAKADVTWELATDAAFTELVGTGVFTTSPAHAHSVHIDATGLEPGRDHHYRFRYADWTSPVGRTRTLPEGSPKAFGIGVVNCQMYESGYFGAYQHLAEEDLDVVVHLGDYIYEYPAGLGPRAVVPNKVLKTLEDYRIRYAHYKRDEQLQAAHARFPFVLTWDDHEVSNNYMGDVLVGNDDPALGQARKAAAYRAWWEHQPTRLDPPKGSVEAVYQAFAAGDLLRLHLLDERQDAAIPPCRDTAQSGTDYGNCDARVDEDRTRLGTDQEMWLKGSLEEGGVTWNLLGNPVVLAGVDGGSDAAAYYLDTWDGFPQARKRLIAQLAEVSNPVVLTGDYHAGMVLDVQAEPFDASSKVVAPEFMSPPISSILFPADVSKRTPQLRQQLNDHGYLTVAVTPERVTVAFRVLDDVMDPKTAISTGATWVVDAGDPVARPA